MKDTEVTKWKHKIDNMTQVEMEELWRFAPVGHPVFDKNLPLFDHLLDRREAAIKVTDQVREKSPCECVEGAACFHKGATVTRIVVPDPRHRDPPYAWVRSRKFFLRRIPLTELTLDY